MMPKRQYFVSILFNIAGRSFIGTNGMGSFVSLLFVMNSEKIKCFEHVIVSLCFKNISQIKCVLKFIGFLSNTFTSTPYLCSPNHVLETEENYLIYCLSENLNLWHQTYIGKYIQTVYTSFLQLNNKLLIPKTLTRCHLSPLVAKNMLCQ